MTEQAKVALVTGGGRGIGRAIALGFAADGLDVAVSARSADQLEAVAAEVEAIGRKAIALPCDATDEQAVYEMVAAAADTLGPVDVLVNNAGTTFSAKFSKVDSETWQRVIDVNLNSAFYCTQAVLPAMLERGWGRIINVASVAGVTAIAYATPYAASKHAMVGFTRALALELARKGITVNAICPGWVDTEMSDNSIQAIMDNTGISRERAEQAIMNMNLQKRLLDPDEVAHVARTLIKREARGVTGQALVVDGGSVVN